MTISFSVWWLRVSWCEAPSLTRRQVRNLLTIISGPCQSSHSWVRVPQNSWPYFTVSYETPPTWRSRSLYLYPPGTGWPSYTPGHWVPFCHLLWLTGEVLEPASTWGALFFKLKLIYDWRSVGQSVMVSGSHLEPMARFLFSVWQLWVTWCGAPSLTRGWVCNLLVQLLLCLARAVTLGSKSLAYHKTFSMHLCLVWKFSCCTKVRIVIECTIFNCNKTGNNLHRVCFFIMGECILLRM
jgi:hypothetical protein